MSALENLTENTRIALAGGCAIAMVILVEISPWRHPVPQSLPLIDLQQITSQKISAPPALDPAMEAK